MSRTVTTSVVLQRTLTCSKMGNTLPKQKTIDHSEGFGNLLGVCGEAVGRTGIIIHGGSKMKKLLLTLLSTLLIIVLSTGCATVAKTPDIVEVAPQYTYESHISPDVFMEWDRSEVEFFTDGENNYAQFILPNPDYDSSIKQVAAVVVVEHNNRTLISYGYNKNGVDFVYVLDLELNRYVLWRSRPNIGNIHKL